jgi:hypothetical protein
MPVYLIESEMPASEMHMWAKYFEARPNAQGVKSSAKEIFPTIAQLSKWEEGAADEDVMRRSLKKSVFGALLEKSVAKG